MGFNEGRFRVTPAGVGLLGAAALLAGCASPGTPRAPSLKLPETVQDLAVMRVGDAVEVRFTVPARTTDGVAIRSATVQGVLCRQDEKAGSCKVVDAEETAKPLAVGQAVAWRDALPAGLVTGPARAVAYRVELRNSVGRSAGYSEAAYAAAGDVPPAVEGFAAAGVRSGVLLAWRAAAAGTADLLVRREQMDGSAAKGAKRGGPGAMGSAAGGGRREKTKGRPEAGLEDGVVWLKPPDAGPGVTEMVDGSIEEGVRYRYMAVRSAVVRVGGRTMEVRSAPSASVEIAWKDVYPPAAVQGLTALGYAANSGYAVDLVWEPVSDPRVTGYMVKRQQMDAAGQAVGAAETLSAEPVAAPGFHDESAKAGESYRYEVTAVDAKGNTSAAAVATVGAVR